MKHYIRRIPRYRRKLTMRKEDNITIIVLDGEISTIEKISKEDLAKAINLGTIHIKEKKPGVVGSVKEGVETVAKASVTGARHLGTGVKSFFRGIKEGVVNARIEYDRRELAKKQEECKIVEEETKEI